MYCFNVFLDVVCILHFVFNVLMHLLSLYLFYSILAVHRPRRRSTPDASALPRRSEARAEPAAYKSHRKPYVYAYIYIYINHIKH